MPRPAPDTPLTTPKARSQLPFGTHWKMLTTEIHIGLRKAAYGGVWLVRWYRKNQQYRQKQIGTADRPHLKADGETILTFQQARKKALETAAKGQREERAAAEGPPPTVRSAIEAYITAYEAKLERQGREEQKRDARNRLTLHVLSYEPLADLPLFDLTKEALRDWIDSLRVAPATIERIIANFKAALYAAAEKHAKVLPPDIERTIKSGLAYKADTAPQARHGQALDERLVRQIIDAAALIDNEDDWDGDLHRMVIVLAATGGRLSQARRIKVGDFQPHYNRIMVPVSFKGTGRKQKTHVGFPIEENAISALLPVSARPPEEPLLERWYTVEAPRVNGKRVWIRERRGPWRGSSQIRAPWKKILDRAGLPDTIVPYAFRHSSIVRLLRLRWPVSLVAAMHDTSEDVIRRHYAAEIVDAMDDLVAKGAFQMSGPTTNVRRLPKSSGRQSSRRGKHNSNPQG